MKHLIEISKIVTKKKVRKIEIFDDQALKAKNSKFNEFYESLMAGKYKNDRDAATALYDCSPTDDKYRQLKSRFRKRLLNTLFFLDVNVPNASSYDRAYYSVNRDWTLVKILLSQGAFLTAYDFARSILTIAEKFNFADVIVNCARILRAHAAKEGLEKEFEEYDALIKSYSNVLEAEIRAEELYQRVIIHYFQPISAKRELVSQMDTYCDALVSLSEQYNSPIITYNMYLVWAYRYEMLNDFEAMLQVCGRAEDYISKNENYRWDEMTETFYLKKMVAYLHQRDYKNGRLEAEKSLAAIEEGSDNWFQYMEYYFLLAMHAQSYYNALGIWRLVTGHPKFRRQGSVEREKWLVFEVYLDYSTRQLTDSNTHGHDEAKKRQRARPFSRPGEEMPNFPKDQRIFAVHYAIVQVLVYMDKASQHDANELIEQLKNYSLRHLKKEEYFRTIAFLRLLQQLAKADYKIDQLSNVDKYYNRLVDEPFYYRGLLNELEVIPYEVLWNIILSKFA